MIDGLMHSYHMLDEGVCVCVSVLMDGCECVMDYLRTTERSVSVCVCVRVYVAD